MSGAVCLRRFLCFVMAKDVRKKRKKGAGPVVKVFFTLGVIAILLFAGLFLYAKIMYSPSHVVDRYVDAFMAQSPNRIFDALELKETSFVTPEKLDELLTRIADYHSITSYSMVPVEEEETADKRCYRITYLRGREKSPFEQKITLKRSDRKAFFLFEKWEISQSGLTAEDALLTVPCDTAPVLDGIAVTEQERVSRTDTTVDYLIGQLFIGTHTLQLTQEGFEDYEDTFDLSAGDYGRKTVCSVASGVLQANEATRSQISKMAERMIPHVYKNLVQDESFDSLRTQIEFENTQENELESKYESLREKHISPPTHLLFVDFDLFSSRAKSVPAQDGCLAIRVTTRATYASGSTVMVGEVPKLETMRSTTVFDSVYHYSNGKWKLYSSEVFDKPVDYVTIASK